MRNFNKYIFVFLIFILIIPTVNSFDNSKFDFSYTTPTNYSLIPTINSSDYWDNLNTPADISYDDLSGGDVNALGYTGFFNYIQGVVGQLSMDGDPWWLGGTDLQLEQELTVDGYSHLNNTYPLSTLTYDLGSGAERWRYLYVQNISADEMDIYNLRVSDNLTVEGYINGVNITELNSNQDNYLNLSGTNADRNMDINSYDLSCGDLTLDFDKNILLKNDATGDTKIQFRAPNNWKLVSEGHDGTGYPFGINYDRTVNKGSFYVAWAGIKRLRLSPEGELIVGGPALEENNYHFKETNNWRFRAEAYDAVNDEYDFGIDFNRNIKSGDFYISNNGTKNFNINSAGNINISKDVVIGGDLNVTGNFIGNQIYAGAWYNNLTGTLMNFASAGVFYNLFLTNATDLNGFTFKGGFGLTSNLTAQVSGRYQVIYSSTGDGQNNHIYVTSIMLNGSMNTIKRECSSNKKMGAGGDIITMNGNCIISIEAGDVISLVVSDDTGGEGNYYGSNINIVRIGDL